MTANYEVVLTDPFGNKLAVIDQFISLEYARKINDIGKMSLSIPRSSIDTRLLIANTSLLVDSRIEIWRSLDDGIKYLDMETAWFIRSVTDMMDSNGTQTYEIEAVDAIELLDRRIIPYNEGNENLTADKNMEADDMMKEIMDENYGASASDSNRDISSYLQVQAQVSAGPTMLKSFSRRKVLTTLKEIAKSSNEQGTLLAFDIVYMPDTMVFEFRTYTTYRGVDRTYSSGSSPLVVGPKYGTLANVAMEYDHTDERNYVYAGGQSVGQIRAVEEVEDTAAINKSPFNRREIFVNASDTDDAAELLDEAENALQNGKAVIKFSGEIIESELARYGRNFSWGDYITAEYEKVKVNVHIDALSVKVSDKGESVTASLRNEI